MTQSLSSIPVLPFPLPPGFSPDVYPEEVAKALEGNTSPLFAKAASFIEIDEQVCKDCEQVREECPTWQLAMIYKRMFAEGKV